PTGRQTAAAVTQAAAAALWLGALAAFGVFASDGVAPGDPLRPWPDPWLVGASGLAFAAAVLTLVQVVQLPGTWAEGRRFSGWAVGRKLRHTLTVLLFTAFAVVLASWGALEPWSS
ncbi:MAG: serine hydrolase, partial [Caulobacteraceae bacterium]|nr:serine hydrolase [Caulobacter sp.]